MPAPTHTEALSALIGCTLQHLAASHTAVEAARVALAAPQTVWVAHWDTRNGSGVDVFTTQAAAVASLPAGDAWNTDGERLTPDEVGPALGAGETVSLGHPEDYYRISCETVRT